MAAALATSEIEPLLTALAIAVAPVADWLSAPPMLAEALAKPAGAEATALAVAPIVPLFEKKALADPPTALAV